MRTRIRPGIIGAAGLYIELPLGGLDHFAKDGATFPFYDATQPSAFYDSVDNKTWLAYEAYDFVGLTRTLNVCTYNHTTRVWSGPYVAITNPMVDDDHGVPSLCMDHQGFVHIFGGSHNDTPCLTAHTTTARDPSTWSSTTNLFTGTYSHPSLVGSALYVFGRDGSTDSKLLLRKTTALSGGVPTYSSNIVIGDFGTNTRWYQGQGFVSGTDIHMLATRADAADTKRQDVYYVIYNTLDGSIRNFAGNVTVASGSQPVDLATMNASFRIVDQTTGSTDGTIPQMISISGNPHIAYMDGTQAGGYNLKHIAWNGSAWTSPLTVGAFDASNALHRYDGLCITPSANAGDVDFFWVAASSPAFTRGGKIVKRTRAAAGTLNSQSDVKPPDRGYAWDAPTPVLNGLAECRAMSGEISDSSSNERQLRISAIGDGGLLKRALTTTTPFRLDFTTGIYNGATIWYERDATVVAFADNLNGSWTTFTGINAGPRRTDKGLLVEPATINQLKNSRTINGSGWTATGVAITADQDTDADGVNTLDTVNKNTASTFRRVSQSFTGTVGTTYTFSANLKAGTLSKATLRTVLGAQVTNKMIDLTAGTITNSSTVETTGFVSASAVQLSNSIWRFTIVVTAPGSGTTHDFWICPGDAGLTTTGTILVGSVQVEIGTTASSAIPSGAAATTRSADEVYFGIPSVVNTLTYTFDDNTTQVANVTAANKGAYMIPTNLNRRIIKTIVGS
jgi:hypothetical protein